MNTIDLSPADLATAAALMLAPGICSLILQLNLFKRIAIASLRTVVQLSLLALILEWVFAQRNAWLVVAVAASMIINASVAAVRRTDRRFAGIGRTSLVAVSVSSVVTTFVVVVVIIEVEPWYEPRYLIPLLGMVLGNTLTGISLALDRVMSELFGRRDEIEGWLALGASHWEACREHVREAIRVGMVPILNSMTVVGIVSLPGMMTGQLLAGASPHQAVTYQIVVMFMVAGGTGIGTVLAVLLAFARLVTRDHQIAHHRIRQLD